MRLRVLGLAFAGMALVAVAAGAGGFRTGPAALFQLCAMAAALVAASLPARGGSRAAGLAGLLLAAVALLSAALAPYRFASLDRWSLWAAGLLLAWGILRLLRAGDDEAEGRVWASRFLLAASLGVLLLQVAGQLGWHPGGAPDVTSEGRLLGSFGSPNHFAEACLLLVFASLPFAGWRGGLARAHAALALVAGAGVALGSSRIAPVALACGLVAWALLRARGRRVPRVAWVAGAGLGLSLLAVAAQVVVSRSNEADAWRRPQIWKAVAPAAFERPLLGLGPGSFRHASHPYNFPVESRVGRYARRPTTPHGEWLRLPIEIGLAGCLALVALLALRLRGEGRGGWPVVAAMLPVAAVHDVLQAPAIAAWFTFVVALTSGSARSGRRSPPLLGAARPQLALALLLSCALGTAGLVVRPSLAEHASRQGRLAAAIDWNSQQPFLLLQAGERMQGPGPPTKLAAALMLFEEAERVAPRLPDPKREQARVLAEATRRLRPQTSSRDAAAAAWDRAAAASPTNPFLLIEQAVFLLQTGEPAKALELAEAAQLLEPRFVDAALVRLIAAQRTGRDEAAALARLEALLAELPALAERAEGSYELGLLSPNENLLELAGR